MTMPEVLKIFSLTAKTAIVTGASRVIGKSIAKGFAEVGVDVVLMRRNRSVLEEVLKEIETPECKTLTIPADIGNPEEIQKTVDITLNIFPESTFSSIMQASVPF